MPQSLKCIDPRGLLQRFGKNDKGNIAVLFAIALVPILTFVGAAVDYTRVSAARTAMQSALDSAALMVSKDLSSGVVAAADVNAKAQAYFTSLYKNKDTYGIAVAATYTAKDSKGKSTIAVTGSGSINTDFMKVAGFPKLDFNTASTTTWGGTRMRVAMALDVTGSMDDDGKLPAMKKAAADLVNKTLKPLAKEKEDIYLSIIPFNVMVNVGNSNKGATWLNWDTDYGSCSKKKWKLKSDCMADGRTWTPSGVNNWKGCVTDRQQDFDITKDAPTSTNADTLFLAKNYASCPSSILPMTSVFDSKDTDTDDTTIIGKINKLVATGNTNQAIGMHWAWMMLQQTDPFVTPAKNPDYKYTDVIILLSDGMNTQDRWYSNSSQIDARQTLLCANIKIKDATTGQRTEIYTIQVNTDGDPESAVLKACADNGSFFPTSTAGGIADAFSAIGTSLTKLRVAQ